jgi:hypothetical protein
MNHIIRIILTAAVMAIATPALAGSLTPPGLPSAGSGMPTTAEIYNRLDTGAAIAAPGAFKTPSAGPTAGTGRSLADIQGKLPVADNTNGAAASDVKAGKTFWGLRDGTWGVKSGTLSGGGYPCTGTMNGTRWCDNGNGTVRDMTTGLIWLKDASWGGNYQWGTTMFDRVSTLANGAVLTGTPATLTDGSAAGDWRMPTKAELVALTTGTEAVLSGTPRAFSGVQGYYWSGSSDGTLYAWGVVMDDGHVFNFGRDDVNYVWPVRSGQ